MTNNTQYNQHKSIELSYVVSHALNLTLWGELEKFTYQSVYQPNVHMLDLI